MELIYIILEDEDGVNMLQELIDKIKKYNPTGDFTIISKAYDFAVDAHQGQKGSPAKII